MPAPPAAYSVSARQQTQSPKRRFAQAPPDEQPASPRLRWRSSAKTNGERRKDNARRRLFDRGLMVLLRDHHLRRGRVNGYRHCPYHDETSPNESNRERTSLSEHRLALKRIGAWKMLRA